MHLDNLKIYCLTINQSDGIMKNLRWLFLLTSFLANGVYAQVSVNEKMVEEACSGYFDVFYNGDTAKAHQYFSPDLYKTGYWKNEDTETYNSEGRMTFDEAINYSKNILVNERFVSKEAPREIVVLDVSEHIAVAKITAWWGIDYMLLSRNNKGWIIEQVLWEGPLSKSVSKQVEKN
jgi:hypothetical protein